MLYREAAMLLIYRHLRYSIVGFYFHVVMTFLGFCNIFAMIVDLKITFYKTVRLSNGEHCVLNRINT